jgi:hypothetical protein
LAIFFNAAIWDLSRFCGLSISVMNSDLFNCVIRNPYEVTKKNGLTN